MFDYDDDGSAPSGAAIYWAAVCTTATIFGVIGWAVFNWLVGLVVTSVIFLLGAVAMYRRDRKA